MNSKLNISLLAALIFALNIQAQDESVKSDALKQPVADNSNVDFNLDELISQIKDIDTTKTDSESTTKEESTQDFSKIKDQVLSAAQKAKSSLDDAESSVEEIINQIKPKEKPKVEEKKETTNLASDESESSNASITPSKENDDILKSLSSDSDDEDEDNMSDIDL